MEPKILPVRPMMPNSPLKEFCTEKQAQEYLNATDMNEYWRNRRNEQS